jgi:hypothetical protein
LRKRSARIRRRSRKRVRPRMEPAFALGLNLCQGVRAVGRWSGTELLAGGVEDGEGVGVGVGIMVESVKISVGAEGEIAEEIGRAVCCEKVDEYIAVEVDVAVVGCSKGFGVAVIVGCYL